MNDINELKQEIQKRIKGEVSDDNDVLEFHSRDTSIFKRRPQLVVFPYSQEDIEELVKIVNENKAQIANLSITPRSGGTCMSGGTITDSIALDMKYLNKLKKFSKEDMYAIVEPGLYYRDFEKVADENNVVYPSYPASKNICAWGGIVNNNSGGEKSLNYGKTQDHVEEVNMILSDGSLYNFKKLTKTELDEKMKGDGFEADIYRKTYLL